AQQGGWAVQAGSFSSLENARRLAATLQSMGYDSFVSETVVDGRNLHRVRIGPLANRKAADRIAKELQQQGQPAKSVPHP
ncbi:MAG: SPOR domain-containing protein, partial [Proteobacteria bacterium]|nr:SPOR domain-containing protein [Pseudomonadota bacterium]